MTNGADEIIRRLDTLVRLVAIAICADRPQKEKIKILSGAGLAPKEIAELLGTTPNTVSVALSSMRSEKNSARRKVAGAAKDAARPSDKPEM